MSVKPANSGGQLSEGDERTRLIATMVVIHKISPTLAAYYVNKMDAAEIKRRFEMYAKIEAEPPELWGTG